MAEIPVLELRDIYFRYPLAQEDILRGVGMPLYAGSRWGLYGPNGAGKTTLLHVAMGLLTPQKGCVLFRGAPVRKEKEFRLLRRHVGLLLQHADDQLFSATVLEDVAFGPLNLGMAPAQARECAYETLALVGLEGFEHRVTHKLSGGEKKLVSLAAVLSMRPEVLLLDEPTNALDPETRLRIISILNALNVGLIAISHDWDFLTQIASQHVTLRDGMLVCESDTAVHHHAHAHPRREEPHTHT